MMLEPHPWSRYGQSYQRHSTEAISRITGIPFDNVHTYMKHCKGKAPFLKGHPQLAQFAHVPRVNSQKDLYSFYRGEQINQAWLVVYPVLPALNRQSDEPHVDAMLKYIVGTRQGHCVRYDTLVELAMEPRDRELELNGHLKNFRTDLRRRRLDDTIDLIDLNTPRG
jgi:hypothetical protein